MSREIGGDNLFLGTAALEGGPLRALGDGRMILLSKLFAHTEDGHLIGACAVLATDGPPHQ